MVYAVLACRALVALVFLASAVGKLRGRAAFAAFVAETRQWRLVPKRALVPAAGTVVVAEAAVPVLVAVPSATRAGVLLAGALLALFTAAIVVTRARGTAARCACFGRIATPLGRRHVLRNALLLAAVAVAMTPLPEAAGAPTALVAVGAGALGALLITTLDEIAGLFSPHPQEPRS
ncbi:MauE/DoxX family redox-associated membrane protein [Streptomyces sp. NPDC053367]|uniref:MauE/DoxX family redox-associated membrane protein n=1 Tax=Streptomyces sp. NPDC053367 TaxID=3365700 RepID=UPI0037D3639D